MDYLIAGIDIAQHHSDVSIAGHKVRRFTHTAQGLSKLKDWLFQHHVSAVILEATGGYERPVMTYLHEHSVTLYRINPARIRAFARAQGVISKTDALDAVVIRQYGEIMHLTVTSTHDDISQLLQDWARRRDQLVEQRKQEKQRCAHPALAESIRHDIEEAITDLDKRITAAEQRMQELIAQNEGLSDMERRMITVPGIAATTARNLMAYLPEISVLDASSLTSLAGLAPHAKESGNYAAPRRIKGGRPEVKRTLYLAALSAKRYNPQLAAFAARLKQKGKAPKQILIAVARKLLLIIHAIITKKSVYDPHHA